MARKSLSTYLQLYYTKQKDILLAFRPSQEHSWADRCMYLKEGYAPGKQYNHRSILRNEVVIEFDTEDPKANRAYADAVIKRLKDDKMSVAVWSSGNKSTHIHFFVDVKTASNISLLKNTIMRHYCDGLPLPDLRLASDNHLIRAEYGKHEKTGVNKEPIRIDTTYPREGVIPMAIWERYVKSQTTVVRRRISTDLNTIETHPGFKFIATSELFKDAEDGRERAMFAIIQVLKHKYKDRKKDFVKYVQDWYRYSGGYKMTDGQILSKVNYHWSRDYPISERYINELCESLGREDLIE